MFQEKMFQENVFQEDVFVKKNVSLRDGVSFKQDVYSISSAVICFSISAAIFLQSF